MIFPRNDILFCMDRRLWIISLIIFIDVLGTGLVLPLLPFFAQELGAGPLLIGLFISTLPFFSILAAGFPCTRAAIPASCARSFASLTRAR